jgi:hypothetical protein
VYLLRRLHVACMMKNAGSVRQMSDEQQRKHAHSHPSSVREHRPVHRVAFTLLSRDRVFYLRRRRQRAAAAGC